MNQENQPVDKMRTGAVGNRSVEDMVKTLVEPKKTVVSSIRGKLIAEGYSEEVEYDAINIEPVITFSKTERKVLFVKHKWELVALMPIQSDEVREYFFSRAKEIDLTKFEMIDETGRRWLKFQLPSEEIIVFKILEKL